jgi:hypothetical protein
MRVVFEQFPSPLTGEGLGGGEDSSSSPPSQPSPAKGGRGVYFPLSASRGRRMIPLDDGKPQLCRPLQECGPCRAR